MAQEFIYQMQGLEKVYGNGKKVLDGIWLSFFPGAKIGVIGPNGAGKSTILKIMAGLDTEFRGETWIEPSASVGYLSQEPQLDETLDVRGNVMLGMGELKELLEEYEAISAKFAEPMSDDEMTALIEKQGDLQDKIDAKDGWNVDRTLDIAMDALNLPPGDSSVKHLSGGEKRRIALCRLLLSKPDLLLLDEPTNHLDAETVAWLERTLRDYAGTVIVVTHDRYFLDNITKWILELEDGKGLPFEGNYSEWLIQKQKRFEQAQKENSARAKALSRELEWVRMGQKGRQAKSKARFNNYEDLCRAQDDAQSDQVRRDIILPPGPRLGNVVIKAENLKKAFDDKLLIDDLSFSLPPGGIVGVIGPNGAGKTTLFKMFSNDETPTSGDLTIGETVVISNVDQHRDALKDDVSVYDAIADGEDVLKVGKREIKSRAYVAAFGFKSSLQQQKVGTLSGGERNRVHLARTLLRGGNLLLLDEPSNDLDVATMRALEAAIEEFAGCAVVISHDRWFLNRIATHILAFEGNSEVVFFEGNFGEYEADKKRRLGEDASRPTRIKYKPLTR